MPSKGLYTFADREFLGFPWSTHRDIARARRRVATQARLFFIEMKRAPCDASKVLNVKVVECTMRFVPDTHAGPFVLRLQVIDRAS